MAKVALRSLAAPACLMPCLVFALVSMNIMELAKANLSQDRAASADHPHDSASGGTTPPCARVEQLAPREKAWRFESCQHLDKMSTRQACGQTAQAYGAGRWRSQWSRPTVRGAIRANEAVRHGMERAASGARKCAPRRPLS